MCAEIDKPSTRTERLIRVIRADPVVDFGLKYWRRRAGICCREQIICPDNSLFLLVCHLNHFRSDTF